MQMSSDLEGFGMSAEDLVLIHRLTERHGSSGMLLAMAAYFDECGDIPDPLGFVKRSAAGITEEELDAFISEMDLVVYGDQEEDEEER